MSPAAGAATPPAARTPGTSCSPTRRRGNGSARTPHFTFVTDGIDSALEQARAVAGDKDVGIGGGANVIQQYLAARLVDELRLHLAPVLLGAGKRLFDHLGNQTIELQPTRVIESPYATHLYYTVRR
jgi:dihydrofolate reductase